MQLLRDPKVIFAGYRNPHPLEHTIEVKIQTTDEYNPKDALLDAITALNKELSTLEENYSKDFERKTKNRSQQH